MSEPKSNKSFIEHLTEVIEYSLTNVIITKRGRAFPVLLGPDARGRYALKIPLTVVEAQQVRRVVEKALDKPVNKRKTKTGGHDET